MAESLARFRFRLGCGHWSPIMTEYAAGKVRVAGVVLCEKCAGESRVEKERRMKDAKPKRPAPPGV